MSAELTLEQKFKALCETIQSLPKEGPIQFPNETKLKFYSYFKQVNEGNVSTPQPYFYQVTERAKWDAWNSVKDMSKEDAMQAYINEMKKVLEKLPYEDPAVQKIYGILGKE